jgi:hypothetical protein
MGFWRVERHREAWAAAEKHEPGTKQSMACCCLVELSQLGSCFYAVSVCLLFSSPFLSSSVFLAFGSKLVTIQMNHWTTYMSGCEQLIVPPLHTDQPHMCLFWNLTVVGRERRSGSSSPALERGTYLPAHSVKFHFQALELQLIKDIRTHWEWQKT